MEIAGILPKKKQPPNIRAAIRPTTDGFALHNVACYYLMEDMNRREPERVRNLRTHIVRELVQEIKACDAYNRSNIQQLISAVFC